MDVGGSILFREAIGEMKLEDIITGEEIFT